MNLTSLSPTDKEPLSPLQAMRILFTYPYVNFVSHFISRTREYETGLLMVDICRELLSEHEAEIPGEEAQSIEKYMTFLELSLYDSLNCWQEYLDLFEDIFQKKRSAAYISTYNVMGIDPYQVAEERFGRYLLGHNERGFQVHSLYLCESRRAIIERKLRRQQEGKNVEHLKRHQKDKLTSEEQERRVEEMQRLFKWLTENYQEK